MNYPIVIKNSFEYLPENMAAVIPDLNLRKVCIISDSNVSGLYGNDVRNSVLPYAKAVTDHIFPAGEKQKHLGTIESILSHLLEEHFDRKDVIVALGGGVAGDIAGFAASIYMRGIDVIQIPTSLLSQVDSSIGGKTGVDFHGYKNLVGAFYEPKLVYMNMNTLQTLPEREYACGLGEIVKHGLLRSESYYSWLNEHCDEILKRDPDVVARMIEGSCRIKSGIVEEDLKENGVRALLNFGHTIGHAVEKECGYSLSHGACVSVGIAAASRLSALKGYLSEAEQEEILDTLKRFRLPVKVSGLNKENVYRAACSDKKVLHGRIRFVLLHSIGDAFLCDDVSEQEVMEAIQYILS